MRRGLSRWVGWSVLLSALLSPSAGIAETRGVGLYVPESALDAYKKYNMVQALAAAMSKTMGVKVKPYAYNRAGVMKRDIKTKKIQFAIVGGIYASTKRAGPILAIAKVPRRQRLWTLMSNRRASLAALRRKTLQLPTPNPILIGLVQNGLLAGNLTINKYFRIVRSPSLESGIAALRAGKAQLVFAPVASAGLVSVVRRTITVPPPAFMVLDPGLPQSTNQAATRALLSLKGDLPGLSGWIAGAGGGYAKLLAQTKKRRMRMLMIKPGTDRLKPGETVNKKGIGFELPELDELYRIP